MQDANNTYRFYGPGDIKRYLEGSMSAHEMHDMEKAALKDPLLADAIDGFKDADAEATLRHLKEIKLAISGLHEKEAEAPVVSIVAPRHIKWWRWGVAACVFGLMAGATWRLMKNTPDLPIAATLQQPAEDSVAAISRETVAQLMKTEAVNKIPGANPAPSKKAGDRSAISATKRGAKEKFSQPAEPADKPIAAEKISTSASPVLAAASQSQASQEEVVGPTTFSARENHRSRISDEIKAVNPNSTFAPFPATPPIRGKIIDEAGNPVPGATLHTAGKASVLSQQDGSFVLAADSSLQVAVSAVGHQKAVALVEPGKINHVKLVKDKSDLNEVVIVGYGTQRKSAIVGAVRDYRKFQEETKKTWKNEIIHPEEGWARFYQNLGANLGNTSSTAKTLEIKFTVDENGDPVDFEIVTSPDEIMTQKAIEMIKKAKWKNFKRDKNATVMIRLN